MNVKLKQRMTTKRAEKSKPTDFGMYYIPFYIKHWRYKYKIEAKNDNKDSWKIVANFWPLLLICCAIS